MRRFVALSVLTAALGVGVWAQTAFSYEQLTAGVNAPAKSLTTSTWDTPTGQITSCMVRVENGSVRYRLDGTAPTSTVGIPLAPVSTGAPPLPLTNLEAQRFSVIQHSSASTTALVNVSCYR